MMLTFFGRCSSGEAKCSETQRKAVMFGVLLLKKERQHSLRVDTEHTLNQAVASLHAQFG